MIRIFHFKLLTGQKFPKQNTKVKQELHIGKQYNSQDYGLEIDTGDLEWEEIMAVGWSHDGDVQAQIDAGVDDAIKLARSRLPEGAGLTHCQECGAIIPDARRKAIPGVRLCISCQSELEEQQTDFTGFNRRGSKDSQLK